MIDILKKMCSVMVARLLAFVTKAGRLCVSPCAEAIGGASGCRVRIQGGVATVRGLAGVILSVIVIFMQQQQQQQQQ